MPLNSLKQSAAPKDDTIPYILVNAVACQPYVAQRSFRATYIRRIECECFTRNITFEEMDLTYPGLTEMLIGIYDDPDLFGSTKARVVNAVTSFIFNAYADLNIAGKVLNDYHYLTGIYNVGSDTQDDLFTVSAVSFYVKHVSEQGIPVVNVNDNYAQRVTTAQLNSIWPDAAKKVLMMEALGYSGYDIAKALNGYTAEYEANPEKITPVLDITFD